MKTIEVSERVEVTNEKLREVLDTMKEINKLGMTTFFESKEGKHFVVVESGGGVE